MATVLSAVQILCIRKKLFCPVGQWSVSMP